MKGENLNWKRIPGTDRFYSRVHGGFVGGIARDRKELGSLDPHFLRDPFGKVKMFSRVSSILEY